MKRLISLILSLCLVFALVPSAQAAEPHGAEEVVSVMALADGGSLTVTRVEYKTQASGTKNGASTFTRSNDTGDTIWTVTLNGSFTYNGTSATCTATSMSFSMSNSHYYVVSASTSKSGNTAIGEFTIGYKLLGITYSTENYTITLSCDKNGNLS